MSQRVRTLRHRTRTRSRTRFLRLGQPRRDGRGSPLELVAKVGPASRKTFDNSVRKCEEFDCCPVDVKSLMIEGGHG